ncbi:hypothetical protein [Colwellia sp. PAMC 21821]|uniref:hypothetical protein n=1 Tax=Colwellia sp. PAMC 21821 TaxID=1816219 RepID=UPI0009BEC75E|nr:hypothetical protein [Colwellia sp. PAMC 21821]ARD43798.1 hypothetical protein A3Q33_05425 [Colwellia sp. PAMC 21821]
MFSSNTKLSIILTLLFVSSAIIWFAFPKYNLEPWIVLITAVIAVERLYHSHFKLKIKQLFTKKQNYIFLNSDKKINALEGSFDDFSNGVTLKLNDQSLLNTPTEIRIFFNQIGLDMKAYFTNKLTVKPLFKFDIGYYNGKEYRAEKITNNYFILQYDIDNDGIDEFIFGVIDNCDIQINILKYHPPLREEDVVRKANWTILANITAEAIRCTSPKIEIKDNTIKIDRCIRGFYYKWIFTNPEVVDVSNI